MEEFALCWNNFSENISNGFQSLLDRGNLLVDCTLACEGKLIHCHKLILAICSPYFQEMFVTNPCKHPIIILKDVSYGIMEELLQFMYQGEVNVKQSELQQFMKIAETLQIKGLTTSSSSSSTTPNNNKTPEHSSNQRNQASTSSPAHEHKTNQSNSQKRSHEESSPRKEPKSKRPNVDDTEFNAESINEMVAEEVFLPQISMIESRFDINNIKRENDSEGHSAPHPPSPNTIIRNSYVNSVPPPQQNPPPHPNFNFEFPNELHSQNDFNKSSGSGYIDPVHGASITMLSSTSLLHGNCIFNRNNTVATQQGMKTYWLCKSYRITMCRARCITHQGRVISATGVHNHPPHMNMKSHEMQNSQGGSSSSHNNSSQSPPQNPYSIQQQQPSNIPMPPQHALHHPGGPPPQLMHYPHFPHHLSHHQQMAMNSQLLQEMNAPPSLQITPVVNMNPTGQNNEMQLLRSIQQHQNHQQQIHQQGPPLPSQQNLQNPTPVQTQSSSNVPGNEICNPSPHSNQSQSPQTSNKPSNDNAQQHNSSSLHQPEQLLENIQPNESLQTTIKFEHNSM